MHKVDQTQHAKATSGVFPQFKDLNIGDTFYIGTNDHPEHIWTKIGPIRARAWNRLTAPFRPNEIINPTN